MLDDYQDLIKRLTTSINDVKNSKIGDGEGNNDIGFEEYFSRCVIWDDELLEEDFEENPFGHLTSITNTQLLVHFSKQTLEWQKHFELLYNGDKEAQKILSDLNFDEDYFKKTNTLNSK